MPTLTFSTGNDTYVVNSAGTYELHFLAGNDTLTVQGGAFTTAYMDDGADVVSLKIGDASVFGGAGADRFEVYASGVEGDGGADNDRFNLRGGSNVTLFGGLGADRFNFYAGAATVVVSVVAPWVGLVASVGSLGSVVAALEEGGVAASVAVSTEGPSSEPQAASVVPATVATASRAAMRVLMGSLSP